MLTGRCLPSDGPTPPATAGPLGRALLRRSGAAEIVLLRVLLLASVLVLLGASCASGEDSSADQAAPPVRILAPEQDESTRGTEASGVRIVGGDYPLEGRILNDPSDLSVGDCFNEYIVYFTEVEPQELITLVDCSVAHDAEGYHQLVHPADAEAPYPSSEELDEWAERRCYEKFANFVGEEYELSQLGIGFRPPTDETWSDPLRPHREVMCYVNAWEGGRVMGSARGSGI